MKKLSPAAIGALKEALASIYWYKRDLQRFLRSACGEEGKDLVSTLDWTQPKVHAVADLLDTMLREETRYQDALLHLMLAVCDVADFSHLRWLEDGAEKAARAEAAVRAVRAQSATYREQIERQAQKEKLREIAAENARIRQQFQAQLDRLRGSFTTLASDPAVTPQARGVRLEAFLRELFALFDLDPRGAFSTGADQVDGAFTFEGGDYLLSAQWRKVPVGIEDLDAFKGKVQTRLENTLGLYISINGFAATAVERHSAAQPVLILMDGADLMAVLDGRIDLQDLLLRKRRHAAQTGEIHLRVSELLTG